MYELETLVVPKELGKWLDNMEIGNSLGINDSNADFVRVEE